ncbi:hypothetical protein Dsin_005017 [Dipteronia sinensis]|uniref:Uncharacterized protein n=1 Tax=Dipteronia sinensis TaxID=43782 RepID=A0AAE0AWK1_9ROSI|nr:hypothetical protein Dsin_005017 [Dipteronia sinensis]
MFTVLKQLDMDFMQRLLPFNNVPDHDHELCDHSLCPIQVNYFRYGGITISFCIMHVIADASASANFVRSWAAIASDSCGHYQNIVDHGVIFDSISLFPALSNISLQPLMYWELLPSDNSELPDR